jgi:hypothetical protein
MVSVRIPLTQDKFAKVSIEDAEYLMQFKWCAVKQHKQFYAQRGRRTNGKKWMERMHWLIAGKGADHVNRDGLDNRRSNLRKATPSQQLMNRNIVSSNTSGHRGVIWDKSAKKWRAQIGKERRNYVLGTFDNIEDAIAARASAEKELFGEFSPS